MKVLQIHVGNEVIPGASKPADYYLQRISFHDGSQKHYTKWDIVNADTQMQSIMQQGVDVVYGHLSDRKSPQALWRAGRRLRELCMQEKIDIVHAYWGTTTALMTTLFSPKPVVISFSGSDLLGNVDAAGRMTKGGLVSRKLSIWAAKMAARVITKSEHMKRSLPPAVQKKTVAIPNGLDLSRFKSMDKDACRDRIGWGKDKKYILYFDGGGAVVKDTPLARKVYELVKAQMSDVEFFIVSGVLHDELVYYYNAADVMLLTSFHEGSNNSIKEARACNTPIVSVNVGDTQERLAQVDNSFVIDSREPRLIADKALEVLQGGKRSNGSQHSADVSHEHIAQQVIAVYKDIYNDYRC